MQKINFNVALISLFILGCRGGAEFHHTDRYNVPVSFVKYKTILVQNFSNESDGQIPSESASVINRKIVPSIVQKLHQTKLFGSISSKRSSTSNALVVTGVLKKYTEGNSTAEASSPGSRCAEIYATIHFTDAAFGKLLAVMDVHRKSFPGGIETSQNSDTLIGMLTDDVVAKVVAEKEFK
jgi:hypothetical protein